MTSDLLPTPRTDAVVSDEWSGGVPLVPYEFAQGLEREIEQLKSGLEQLLTAYESYSQEFTCVGDGPDEEVLAAQKLLGKRS